MNDGRRANAAGKAKAAKIGPVSRVKVPAIVAGLAALLFAMLLVLWALSRASDRQSVWQVSRPITAGQSVTAEALVPVGVASDRDGGLIPVSDKSPIGLVATHDLVAGGLLDRSDVSPRPVLVDDEQAVGAVLRPGKAPADLRRGDVVLLTELSTTASPVGVTTGAAGPTVVRARVIELSSVSTAAQVSGGPGIRQGVEVVLAVAATNAVLVAEWSGGDRLLVVREARK
jgi:hypothetical protein